MSKEALAREYSPVVVGLLDAFGVMEQEAPIELPQGMDLSSYERFIVLMSGGKDSVALLLVLLELGVPREKIEIHHHLVDGKEGPLFMDWPVTESYVQALGDAFGIPVTYSWRIGGFLAEMERNDQPTAPCLVPDQFGGYEAIGGSGPLGTRKRFPQVSADLKTRWCSAALKIGPFAAYVNNHPKFNDGRTLVMSGERAEESPTRAHYQVFEPHRCDNRHGKRVVRYVDHWRAVHAWSETAVWNLIRKYKVTPHACYYLGWGRSSCRLCLFGSKHQWATARLIAPEQFAQVAAKEREYKVTIHRKDSVETRADAGTPYTVDPYWVEVANSTTYNRPIFMDPWVLPAGAFGEGCGPT